MINVEDISEYVKEEKQLKLKGFKGLKTDDDAFNIPLGFSPNVNNVSFTRDGSIVTMSGKTQQNITPLTDYIYCRGAHRYLFNGDVVAAFSNGLNTKMFYYTPGADTFVAIDSVTYDKDAFFSFDTYNGEIFWTNGSDPITRWTGTGASSVLTASAGTVPIAKYLIFFQDRMVVANTTVSGQEFRMSGSYDVGHWDTTTNGAGQTKAFTLIIDDDDENDIAGINVYGQRILIKRGLKGAQLFYGFDETDYNVISTNVDNGVIARRSGANSSKKHFYVSEDGIEAIAGVTTENQAGFLDSLGSDSISRDIKPTLTAVADKDQLVAEFFNDQYFLSKSDFGVMMDLATGSFSKCSLIHNIEAYIIAPNRIFYGIGRDDGKIFQLFDGSNSDNGEDFDREYETNELDFDAPEVMKRVNVLRVQMDTNSSVFYCDVYVNGSNTPATTLTLDPSVPFSYYTNEGDESESWASFFTNEGDESKSWASFYLSSTAGVSEDNIFLYAKTIRLRFYNSLAGDYWKVYKAMLDFEYTSLRRNF